MSYQVGSWVWSQEHGQAGRVIEGQSLWGQDLYLVWMPQQEKVIRATAEGLRPLDEAGFLTGDHLAYIAAAARISEALNQDLLLAPIGASIIPLPHQVRALSRVMDGDRIRYLLADEVGLGKTIEAGLIMRELKLRGRVQRVLVVTPKGLVTQWVAEMRTHFNEDFRLVIPSALLGHLHPDQNLWESYTQVVCPMDSIKPIESRRGWSPEQVALYNRQRFDDLVSAGWDLIIVDEAHRLGGASEQVARYILGQGLSKASPYLLLLSATPHQGKSDAFRRVLSLLDVEAFPDDASIRPERVWPYVIRTAKRAAIDIEGKPLFKPRVTQLWSVDWDPEQPAQRALYEAVSDYVRQGYNQALLEKKSYIGFLLILMQRLVTSSTRAVRATLERRLEALREPEYQQLSLFDAPSSAEWAEMDGQEQVDNYLRSQLHALANEQSEVEHLLELAAQAEAAGADPKAQALLDWIYRLQRETGDPSLKVLIFTEFVPTQAMLQDFLSRRGYPVAVLNGSMNLDERQAAQLEFAGPARFLISTDAGGEGLNLQFCHVVINYDIPWNPMRLEQRIGRVDRIGQTKAVRAVNFLLADTVEARVQEVLENKLKVILEQFGVDKTADVLDSAEASSLFDDLYREVILDPESLESRVEETLQAIEEQAQANREGAGLLAGEEPLNPEQAQKLLTHPLPRWLERMTVSYVRAHGGSAALDGPTWRIRWPGDGASRQATFSPKGLEPDLEYDLLPLDNPKVRELVTNLPIFIEGQAVPRVSFIRLPAAVQGIWSLWRLALTGRDWDGSRVLPLFQGDDGQVLAPTASRIWEQLLSGPIHIGPIHIGSYLDANQSREVNQAAWNAFQSASQSAGQLAYSELSRAYQAHRKNELEKREYAFAARRKAIDRLGLPSVRHHRLDQLAQDESAWRRSFESSSTAVPELDLLLLLRVKGLES